MSSIYQRAMSSDFERLHPQIQRRFGQRPGEAAIGRGVMDHVWHGAAYTLPFLYIGTWRSIMFPERGHNIPFSIQNYSYLDPLGRETVTWVRTFETEVRRRFDAYMVYSEERERIVDYLGTHQHLAVDLELSVAPNGGLKIRSGEQRFYQGPVEFRFPQVFSGIADVCEWFDDAEQCFRIEVTVTNKSWGRLFGYRGRFQVEWLSGEAAVVPAEVLPRRVEGRE